jgi:hypothetical protein
MTPRARLFAAWFSAGVLLPPAVYGFGALLGLIGADRVGQTVEFVALGGCPFWLFLWIPAMSQPNNWMLFYSTVAAVLLANGCLYLLMALLQSWLRSWRKPYRVATLLIAYPVLMALGYSLPFALEGV